MFQIKSNPVIASDKRYMNIEQICNQFGATAENLRNGKKIANTVQLTTS
jgi:hypothetical protein